MVQLQILLLSPLNQSEGKRHQAREYPSTHKVSRNHTVRKLQQAERHEEDEEGVQQLHALRRLVHVAVPDPRADLLQVLRVAHMARGGR